MKLRARWAGPLPQIGDYLMSSTRPRFAYRLTQVLHPSSQVRWDAEAHAEIRRLQFVVDRVAAAAVPKAARVHPWQWDRRGPATQPSKRRRSA